ncbi:MAG TPA: hypothetical protein VMQ10_07725 [Spirochaetia bacterium]|nr:hypothetical protein [Spirochaetia bacterium]
MIGFIVAMRREAAPLLRRAGAATAGTIAGLESRCFTLHGTPCILVYCGIGMERARSAAAAFIRSTSPSLLVSFGIAGCVEDDLEIGDVVAASHAALLGRAGSSLALAAVADPELQAMRRSLSEAHASVYRGSVLTTRGETVGPAKAKGLLHPVLDMETYAIAEEAAGRGIPLVSLRGVSDSPREPLPFDLSAMTDAGGSFRAGRLLGQAIRRPGMLRRLSRLRAAVHRAEENVTAAVMELVAARSAQAATRT